MKFLHAFYWMFPTVSVNMCYDLKESLRPRLNKAIAKYIMEQSHEELKVVDNKRNM